jgi:hypothetical protein
VPLRPLIPPIRIADGGAVVRAHQAFHQVRQISVCLIRFRNANYSLYAG